MSARVIGVLSGKGGVGKTTVVVNLGAALASVFKQRVAVIDCNICTSHMGLYLGMYDSPVTLNHVLRGEADISSAVRMHPSGMGVVPASLSLKDLAGVDVSLLGSVIGGILRHFDFVLLDASPGFTWESVAVMQACDEALFVAVPQVAAAVDILRSREMLREVGAKRELGMVLNMVARRGFGLSVEDVQRMAELPVVASIPADANILRSLRVRSPIVTYRPGAPASIGFVRLAADIAGYRPGKGAYSRLMRLFGRHQEAYEKVPSPGTGLRQASGLV